jgi:hypothetical protein
MIQVSLSLYRCIFASTSSFPSQHRGLHPITMSDLVRDSVFGQLVRLTTGGRVFQYPDEYDESIREKYINKEKSGNLALYGSTSVPQEAQKENDLDSSISEGEEDSEKDLEKHGNLAEPERGATPTSPAATRVTSRGSNIARMHSSDARPSAMHRINSRSSSFMNELRETRSRQSVNMGRVNTASGRSVDPEKGRDIDLVDWYGPDDPEVCSQLVLIYYLLTFYRTRRIGPVPRNSGSLSKYAFSPSQSTWVPPSILLVSSTLSRPSKSVEWPRHSVSHSSS